MPRGIFVPVDRTGIPAERETGEGQKRSGTHTMEKKETGCGWEWRRCCAPFLRRGCWSLPCLWTPLWPAFPMAPIIFGCHQKPERSFFYHGKQFPLCARCTGELVGISSGVILFWFWKPCLAISVSIMIPMLIDGFVQRLTPYESTNARRFITGFLFGLGLASIFLVSVSSTFANGYKYGLEIGKNIKK